MHVIVIFYAEILEAVHVCAHVRWVGEVNTAVWDEGKEPAQGRDTNNHKFALRLQCN